MFFRKEREGAGSSGKRWERVHVRYSPLHVPLGDSVRVFPACTNK